MEKEVQSYMQCASLHTHGFGAQYTLRKYECFYFRGFQFSPLGCHIGSCILPLSEALIFPSPSYLHVTNNLFCSPFHLPLFSLPLPAYYPTSLDKELEAMPIRVAQESDHAPMAQIGAEAFW